MGQRGAWGGIGGARGGEHLPLHLRAKKPNLQACPNCGAAMTDERAQRGRFIEPGPTQRVCSKRCDSPPSAG